MSPYSNSKKTATSKKNVFFAIGTFLVGWFMGQNFSSLGMPEKKFTELSSIGSFTSTAATAAAGDIANGGSVEDREESVRRVDYVPAKLEQYFADNMITLGWDKNWPVRTCDIWLEQNKTNPEIFADLVSYGQELDQYTEAIEKFEPIPDLMGGIKKSNGRKKQNICKQARVHPDGLEAIFPSKQLSLSNSGYIDPLLPPMRSHKICQQFRRHLFDMNYLVHDFESMCLKLKPTSQRVLIDMGASLDFHGKKGQPQPIVILMELYEKFGFNFDHIYAFEVTQLDPNEVFGKMLPEKYMPAYHWMNVGVSAEEGHRLNPLHSILKTFDEDDLIVVKIDIDTSSIEVPLVQQILEDKDGVYGNLIDQFYFEHHVLLKDVPNWAPKWKGTVKESFDIFTGLRKKGIAAHFWL